MAKERVFAVFGLGAFGSEVCRSLTKAGAAVVAFDNNPRLVERIQQDVSQAVLLDSTDEEALNASPVTDAEAAVVAIGDNIEASILTTALLKKIGVPRILARAVSDLHLRVLRQLGADEVYNVEIEEGRHVAARLIAQDLLDTIPISEHFSIAELYVPEPLIGTGPGDVVKRYDVQVVAIKRRHTTVDELGNPQRQETVSLPRAGDLFQEGDVFLVVGRNDDIDSMRLS